MILRITATIAAGLAAGREYEAQGVAVYCVPGIYGGRCWAVLDNGEEARQPTAFDAAIAFVEAVGVAARLKRRERDLEAAQARGWRRVGVAA